MVTVQVYVEVYMFDLAKIDNNHPIWQSISDLSKSRSDFQLEKFVIGQHDTSIRQFKQIVLELSSLLYDYKIAQIKLQQLLLEAQELEKSTSKKDNLEAQIKYLELERSQTALLGAEREITTLLDIYDKSPKYSLEDLERDEANYWSLRLSRQAQLEAIGGNGQVAWGSLDALRQIGTLDLQQEFHKLQVESGVIND